MIDYSLLLTKPARWQARYTQKENNQQFQNPIKNAYAWDILHIIAEVHRSLITNLRFGALTLLTALAEDPLRPER